MLNHWFLPWGRVVAIGPFQTLEERMEPPPPITLSSPTVHYSVFRMDS